MSARNFYSAGTYSITCPSGRIISAPPKGMYWRVSKEKFEELDDGKRIWWGRNGDAIPQIKRFLSEVKDGRVPQTLWFYKDVGHTQEAKKELLELVHFDTSNDVFITPKPTRLLQRILQIATDKDSLVLDSFAGSGTTAHAVLKQNAEDGGTRRCILVEMDPKIARTVAAERVRRVALGYTNAKGEAVAGLGGGFRYARLGKEVFAANRHINPEITFAELAGFVWFRETGAPLPTPPGASPFLGVHNGKAVYLLYNGILKDKSASGGNVLTSALLAELPPHGGDKVVYGTRRTMSDTRLAREHVTFKQLPYVLEAER